MNFVNEYSDCHFSFKRNYIWRGFMHNDAVFNGLYISNKNRYVPIMHGFNFWKIITKSWMDFIKNLKFFMKQYYGKAVVNKSKKLWWVLFILEGKFCLRKYFWAWLATWIGVVVVTKFLEMPFQWPLPSFSSPTKNVRCSSLLHMAQLYVHHFNHQSN